MKAVFRNFKNSLKRIARADLMLGIYAVLLAVLLWFIIAMTLYPSVPKTVENVSVDIELTGSGTSISTNTGLLPISCDVEKVNIRIKGPRTKVGNLDSRGFTAYFDMSNITTPGKKSLNIKIANNSGVNCEIESISPSVAEVTFDEFSTIDVPVEPYMPNIKPIDGKTIYDKEITCEPSAISITGPAAQLSKIDHSVAVIQKEKVLDSAFTTPSEGFVLYSKDGAEIDQKMIKVNTSNVMVTVPVVTRKNVDLDVKLLKVPNGFITDGIKLKIEPESIAIASKNSQAELPDVLEIAQIYLRDLKEGYSNTFNISGLLTSNDLINMSGETEVKVTLENTGLKTKRVQISGANIRMTNVPANGDKYTAVTQYLMVTIIGPAEVVDNISIDDVYAEVNLLNNSSTQDEFSVEAMIVCQDHPEVWWLGKIDVNVRRTPAEQEG